MRMRHSSSVLLAGLAFTFATPAQRRQEITKYEVQTPPLDTPWTYTAGIDAWPEYPRPQLQRSQWQSLNGIWTYQNASNLDALKDPPFSRNLAHEVLIPSCLESALSGIQGSDTLYSWFATTFLKPSDWAGDRVLLNFGAVDYEATVFVNGKKIAFHRGGYFTFTIDVTLYLTEGENSLLVFVHDPTDSDPDVIPVGKQSLSPTHYFYRSCSGIWQQVWIESALSNYITDLHLSAGADGQVNATVSTSDHSSTDVKISILDRKTNKVVAEHDGTTNTASVFTLSSPRLWTPESPNLYDIEVQLGEEIVKSYTGFRTISRGVVDGVERPLLNGKLVFLFGTLDQGFWPDGVYVPPNYEAMTYDIKMLKNLGFNMLRKHIKVENPLFYQAADELGIMIIQDMPAMKATRTPPSDCGSQVLPSIPNGDQQAEFSRQLDLLIIQIRNYPSVVAWVLYNEGWGQILTPYFPEFGLTDRIKQLDPTRLVDSTTGWYDHGAGDFSDNHHYANPQCGSPFYSINSKPYDPTRIGFQGEFGGIGNNVSIEHLWNVQASIDTINQTYEIDTTLEAWNYRAHLLLDELRQQTELFACSGGVWTQTTDVECEVNGLLTYDRRVLRPVVSQWQADLQALYAAANARSNASAPAAPSYPPFAGQQGPPQFGPGSRGGGNPWSKPPTRGGGWHT